MLSKTQQTNSVKRELIQRELARRRLLDFTTLTCPMYSAGWVHHDIATRLERFSKDVADRKSPRLMLLMPPRHGKLLADDTPVFTTTRGWVTHGELRVGDRLIGRSGLTKVVAVGEPDYATHRVTFSSGVFVDAHLDHEWTLRYRKYHQSAVDLGVVDTRFLLEKHQKKYLSRRAPDDAKGHGYIYSLPAINLGALSFRERFVISKYHIGSGLGPAACANYVASVTELPTPKRGRCIQVDAYDGLYAVTERFLLTHNSELASVRFPAWHLGQYPHHEIINVGYNLDLPMEFSRKVRDLVRSPLYSQLFPKTTLNSESQSVESWRLMQGGGFLAAGVGGGITGRGAHILIIDDPIKSQQDADSAVIRNGLEAWYQTTAYTRLAPGGGVLLIQTCWSDDDLAGRLQQAAQRDSEADQFEIVRYPALAEQWEYRDETTLEITRSDTPLEATSLTLLRQPGEALHAQRFSAAELHKKRSNVQPRVWSALFQQNPVPDDGLYFRDEYFKHIPAQDFIHPHGCRIYTGWDFAIGEKQVNDYTVGATILHSPSDVIYVLDVQRLKADSLQIIQAMIDTAKRFSTLSSGYMMGVEDGQIWKTLAPMFRQALRARNFYPVVEVLPPLSDKMVRARPLQGRMQMHSVIFPDQARWLDVVKQELLRFPAGVHDDCVDALSWAVHLSAKYPPPKEVSAKGRGGLDSYRTKFGSSKRGGFMSA